MLRSLASIQRVDNLVPIEGADFIEEAQVLGWRVIVKKGEFQVGDLGVFFEVDSVLPVAEWNAFLKGRQRIKTVRMRGVLSQGLLLPLSILPLPDGFPENTPDYDRPIWRVGEDVTELLGVTKWEPEVKFGGETGVGWPFPTRVPKTDEIRVQTVPDVLEEMHGIPYVATVKLDGTSFTAMHDGEKLIVCSRNYSLNPELGGPYWEMAKRLDLETKLKNFPGVAIQGELCGPGIQKNRLRLQENELYLYSLYDTCKGRYYNHDAVKLFAEVFGLQTVPLAFEGDAFNYTLEELLERAKGNYASGQRREGIVIRPRYERYSKVLRGRLSFKVINNDFLLKDED
jgi:RNA ligase (TIGR02306 family)